MANIRVISLNCLKKGSGIDIAWENSKLYHNCLFLYNMIYAFTKKKKFGKLRISTKESKNISHWKLPNRSKHVELFAITIGIEEMFNS